MKFYSINRRRYTHIFGKRIKWDAHASDMARLEALLLLGGVYLDFDAFAVRDFDPLLNERWVMGYEKRHLLNNGVLLAERNAIFGVLWYCEYARDYDPHWYIELSVRRPHQLAQRCPHLLRREIYSLNFPDNHHYLHLLFGENVYFDLSNNYVVHGWLSCTYEPLVANWLVKFNSEREPPIMDRRYTMGRIWNYLYWNDDL